MPVDPGFSRDSFMRVSAKDKDDKDLGPDLLARFILQDKASWHEAGADNGAQGFYTSIASWKMTPARQDALKDVLGEFGFTPHDGDNDKIGPHFWLDEKDSKILKECLSGERSFADIRQRPSEGMKVIEKAIDAPVPAVPLVPHDMKQTSFVRQNVEDKAVDTMKNGAWKFDQIKGKTALRTTAHLSDGDTESLMATMRERGLKAHVMLDNDYMQTVYVTDGDIRKLQDFQAGANPLPKIKAEAVKPVAKAATTGVHL